MIGNILKLIMRPKRTNILEEIYKMTMQLRLFDQINYRTQKLIQMRKKRLNLKMIKSNRIIYKRKGTTMS